MDIRMVVTDMDGTLLDDDGRVPEAFWAQLALMRERGILFVPASGRQYATLARTFADAHEGLVYVAENGSLVMRDDHELSATVLAPDVVGDVVRAVREHDRGSGRTGDSGVVVCGKRSAYVERTDPAFLAEAGRYYARLARVDDVLAVEDEVVKVAVFDFGDAATGTLPTLERFRATHQVVVSGEHWVDVMDPAVNKGVAVRRIQERLGITPAQTVAFGDYLNDLEMLDAAEHSYAMANAHPEVVARARHRAPSSSEQGVVTVLDRLLGGVPAC